MCAEYEVDNKICGGCEGLKTIQLIHQECSIAGSKSYSRSAPSGYDLYIGVYC